MKVKLFAFAICSVIGLGSIATAQQDTMMKNDSMKQETMMKTDTMMKKSKRHHKIKRHHRRHKMKRMMGS